MSTIRAIEMKLVDQLFESDPGYVLDLSIPRFTSFFGQELGVDIYQDRYAQRGTSKMNRLRCYLETADDKEATRALSTLWEYRTTLGEGPREVPNGEQRLSALIQRLGGAPIATAPDLTLAAPASAVSTADRAKLQEALIAVSSLDPRARGLAFERLLRDLFSAYGLAPRGSINIRGEQIDGSFELDGQTYLTEAKWQAEKTGAGDLHTFEGKLGQKATWTRGVFISQTGFTGDGLHAFGRGKRLVCMDGLDLWDTLNGTVTFPDAIRSKVARASQTGEIFVRVRDL